VERNFTGGKDLDLAASLLVTDPNHRGPAQGGGEPYSEIIERASLSNESLPEAAVALKIIHEPGGTFLAVPLGSDQKPLDKATWWRSNSRG
jgi:hypothetical protein